MPRVARRACSWQCAGARSAIGIYACMARSCGVRMLSLRRLPSLSLALRKRHGTCTQHPFEALAHARPRAPTPYPICCVACTHAASVLHLPLEHQPIPSPNLTYAVPQLWAGNGPQWLASANLVLCGPRPARRACLSAWAAHVPAGIKLNAPPGSWPFHTPPWCFWAMTGP